MPKSGKPRSGSLQYWPRKRTSRIYANIKAYPKTDEIKPLDFACWKAGMTHVQILDNSNAPTKGQVIQKPVTILDCPSMFVCGARLYKMTANGFTVIGDLWSPSLPKSLSSFLPSAKKSSGVSDASHVSHDASASSHSSDFSHATDVRLIVCTQPTKAGIHKKKPEMFEVGIGGSDIKQRIDYAKSMIGKELHAKDVFQAGEDVDVVAVTKGHGYTGPVKRFGIKLQGRKDKQHHRHAGSKGQERPGKQRWQVPMPGQYGFFRRTEFNKRIIMIDDDSKKINVSGGFLRYGVVPGNFIMVEGSVPGPAKRLIRLRKAVRSLAKPRPVDIKYISVESKQSA